MSKAQWTESGPKICSFRTALDNWKWGCKDVYDFLKVVNQTLVAMAMPNVILTSHAGCWQQLVVQVGHMDSVFFFSFA